MLTPPKPKPGNYELGEESPRYKADLSAWKQRKQDERDHPEKYGEAPVASQLATNNQIVELSGRVVELTRKLAEFEARQRK